MRTRRVAWFAGVGLALTLGTSACGGEDEGPGAADPAVAGVAADQFPAAVAPDPAASAPVSPQGQPAVPAAAAVARPSPGSLASSNWHPSPPPCSDCPVAPGASVAVDPAPVAPPGAR